MARKTGTARAVAQAFGDSTRELVTVILKGKDGKDHAESRSVSKAVLAIISEGMKLSDKLESLWKDNADKIIGDFYKAVPKGTKAEIMKFFRESEEIDTMYQVFQQRHPQYGKAQKWLEESKVGGEEGDKSKAAYNAAIRTIRATAMNQAIKVCGYYAADHATDKKSDTREQETARSLIEAVIHDWANRVTLGRGAFKEADEKALLNAGIDALRKVLDNERMAKARKLSKKNPQNVLGLGKPVGRAAQAAAQKAGEVTVLTGAEAQAAVQQ